MSIEEGGEAVATVVADDAKPQIGTVQLHQIQLELFESLVYSNQTVRGGLELVSILAKLRTGAGFTNYPRDQFIELSISVPLYTRLASAIVALFANPMFELTEEGFEQFAVMQPIIDAVFSLSEYRNSDHLLKILADDPMEPDAAKRNFSSQQAFAKGVLAWSINSEIDIDFKSAFTNAKALLFPWYLGVMSRVAMITKRSHQRYNEMLDMADMFADTEVPPRALAALSDANMHCSYATPENKHHLKRVLSRDVKRSWAGKIGAGISAGRHLRWDAPRRPLGGTGMERPVMVFPIEWWTSFHAMYRCYAPVVEQLRPYFRCVAFSRAEVIDTESAKSFDEVIPIASGNRAMILQEILDNIQMLKPDVIYYLSAGMAQWWTALSAMRLAPLQILSLGHPASSMSSEMDYVLIEQGNALGADTFIEDILELPPNALRFVRRADEDNARFEQLRLLRSGSAEGILLDSGARIIDVAVPSMAAKLNYPFIKLLKEVKDEVKNIGNEVRYHFFPNMLGMGHLLMAKQLTEALPDSVVHLRTGYDAYLDTLALCDVHASPFPFGGTNSNLDSLQIGIPILTLEGPREVHERYDAAMLRRAGLPDLIAGDVTDYKALLLRLCTDVEFLHEQKQKALVPDIVSLFYGELQFPAKDAFARSILYAYRNHHRIKGKGKTRWEQML